MVEKTRYTNPLKSKFRAKRLAAESWWLFCDIHFPLTFIVCSRWRCFSPGAKTSERPNAGRIPSTKQDSFPTKPSRICHKGPTHRLVFSVCYFMVYSYLPAHPHNSRYPNLHEVRLIPTKRDIAFVEFLDEGSAGVAKDALHNYKLDGENKIKVRVIMRYQGLMLITLCRSRLRGSSRCMYMFYYFVAPSIRA